MRFSLQFQAKLNVFNVSIGLHGNELCIMPYILNLKFEFPPITTSLICQLNTNQNFGGYWT